MIIKFTARNTFLSLADVSFPTVDSCFAGIYAMIFLACGLVIWTILILPALDARASANFAMRFARGALSVGLALFNAFVAFAELILLAF